MNEITCDLCMDLLPLVADGVASPDSVAAVQAHMATCSACRAHRPAAPPPVEVDRGLAAFRRRLRLWAAMLMVFGLCFGLSLTVGPGMFYNSYIMPLVGVLGYVVFRGRVFYTVPPLLLITQLVVNGLGLLHGAEQLDLGGVLLWSLLYSVLAALGALAAWLLHFAFGKGPGATKGGKEA